MDRNTIKFGWKTCPAARRVYDVAAGFRWNFGVCFLTRKHEESKQLDNATVGFDAL